MVLRASGRLDAGGAQQLKNEVDALVEQGHHNLVLVMERVSFVASSGIGTMLVIADVLRRHDGKLVVAAPSGAVTSVVGLLNLGAFLEIATSEEAAVAVFEASNEHV
jgi:anti-anti-sigma factor